MSLINIKNLTFSYESSYDNIFENVNLQIDTNWKLGLVGRNGKGKTTFLRLLLGNLSYKGDIQSQIAFEYFPFEVTDKQLTVYEILESINPQFEEWKIQKELNLLGFGKVDFYRTFNTFSNGECTKILLGALFSKENTFLLIDEPTNHLDRQGREVLSRYLRTKSSYIIVSHDKRFLDNCIDHVMSINKSNIEVQSGNLSSYLENKKRRDTYEFSENERLKTEISRLKESSRRTSDWANKAEKEKFGGKDEKSGLRPDRGYLGAKASKIMSMATNMHDRIENSIQEKTHLLNNIDRKENVTVQNEKYFKNRLLAVKDLVIIFDGIEINKPLSFEVIQGDRISLVGKNGCGKTSIIKAITGINTCYAGEICANERLAISYVSQDTSFLHGNISEFCGEYSVDKTMLMTMLFKFGFERAQFEKDIQTFSEGQKKKLLIAKSLCAKAHLYIWDEPLNYIDIISREQIKEMLTDSDLTIIFVEHDADFSDCISNKQIIIE